jgi:hypothetical protein
MTSGIMGRKNSCLALVLLVILVFQCVWVERVWCVTVTYDHKALVIDGKRRVLQSGSIHYPRTTPEVGSWYYLNCKCAVLIGFVGYMTL